MVTTIQKKSIRLIFYGLWFAISIIQAYYTELLADEAYYWKYSQNLAWGYFDHPPVVAILIKCGYALFQNELGVRLLFILSNLGFFYLLERLTHPKNLALFYLAISSIAVFHFVCIMALPDMPLLLFTASFLLLYRSYLKSDNLKNVLLLSINIALLLLSKYLGILVIIFTLLSNLKLLERKSFWLIVITSILLFSPHIYWQYTNGFPSIKYHLSERSGTPYQFEFTLNYLLSFLLILSPIVGIVLFWHSTKEKAPDSFNKALKALLIGIPVFFFVMTFKGRSEANWLVYMLIPAIALGYPAIENKAWSNKFIRISFLITVPLLLVGRFYMMYDFLPDQQAFKLLKNKIHYTSAWANDIREKAQNRPVVFMNKYQYAAQYEFYTKQPAISLNNRMGRKNQYNIWEDEAQLQGKPVLLIPNYDVNGIDHINTPKGSFQYFYLDNFSSASLLRVIPTNKEVTSKTNATIDLSFRLNTNDSSANWDYERNPDYPLKIQALWFIDGQLQKTEYSEFFIKNDMIKGREQSITLQTPQQAGDYQLYLDIAAGWLPPAINSKKISATILN